MASLLSSNTVNDLPNCILIITVTKVEAQAVLDVFSSSLGKEWTRETTEKKTYYNLGSYGGVPVFMVQSEMGVATPGGALLTVNQAIKDLNPQAIIMCGIAYGLRPDKQELGDILIARQLEYYEPKKIDVHKGTLPRGDCITASDRMLDRFRSGDIDWKGAKTHFGLVLSGEKLVNDPKFREELLETEPEAIGGEMEGAGMYTAARDSKTDWILVKAICDWADGTKKDDAQSLAARNAAEFVLHALSIGGWDNFDRGRPSILSEDELYPPTITKPTTSYSRITDHVIDSLADYIQDEKLKSIATFILNKASNEPLPPLQRQCVTLLNKLVKLLDRKHDAINSIEAFILLGAVCLPHLLSLYDDYSETQILQDSFRSLIDKLDQEPDVPAGLRDALAEIAPEVIAISNARANLILTAPTLFDCQLRGIQIRKRFLGAILRLADNLDLDHYIDPNPPKELHLESWHEKRLWWKQAYVISVEIQNQRICLHFRLPSEHSEKYSPILVYPLNEFIQELIRNFDQIPLGAGFNLRLLDPIITDGDIISIPEDEWQKLKKEIELEQANKTLARTQEDRTKIYRLKELQLEAHTKQAEQMQRESRHKDAATLFSLVANLLAREQEFFQAKEYAIQAAEAYSKCGDLLASGKQYLFAVDVWMRSTLPPEFVEKLIEEVEQISLKVNDPEFRIQAQKMRAWISFAYFMDADAKKYVEQAFDNLEFIKDDALRSKLLRELSLQIATFHMIWEEPDKAKGVLVDALDNYEINHEELANLYTSLLIIATECADWLLVDDIYQKASLLPVVQNNPNHKGIIELHYGASLACRGKLDDAYETFNKALQYLHEDGNAYSLALAYQNMQFMLIKNGAFSFNGMNQHEARRIDLFNQTLTENRGYSHQTKAKASLISKEYRTSIQHLRFALYCYWQVGDRLGIQEVYKTLARLHLETNEQVDALIAAVHSGDNKLVESISKIILEKSEVGELNDAVSKLFQTNWPSIPERYASLTALNILADVIPQNFLDLFINNLIQLLVGTESNILLTNFRCQVIETLGSLASQFDATQARLVILALIEQLSQKQHWTVIEKAFRTLESIYDPNKGSLLPDLYEKVSDLLISDRWSDDLNAKAQRVAILVALSAPHGIRSKIATFIRSLPNDLDRSLQLVILGEKLSEEQLQYDIRTILSSINPRPNIIGSSYSIGFSGIDPRAINGFNDVFPENTHQEIINGLLESIINEHNHLSTRSSSIWALSRLPLHVLKDRADEITEYLLWGTEGTLPTSSLIKMDLESQVNPYSMWRMNTGNMDQIRQSSLRALGKLFPFVSAIHQEQIYNQFIVASRDTSPVVRQGVAMAMDLLDGDISIPPRMIVALMVLLHDVDALPCSWASVAGGHLIQKGLIIGEFTNDLLERIMSLSRISHSVEIRVGVAIGLKASLNSKGNMFLEDNLRNRLMDALKVLSSDISFRVRHEARI